MVQVLKGQVLHNTAESKKTPFLHKSERGQIRPEGPRYSAGVSLEAFMRSR